MDGTRPKPFVFVLMPFEPEFSDVYALGIKPACEGADAYCERVDEQIFSESILSRIYNQISKSDLVVADMTGRNPNVFYEVGYAHALGKNVVLLTKQADDIPFDLKHYPHVVYGDSIASLKGELAKRVQYHLAQPSRKESPLDLPLEFYIDGQRVADGAFINTRIVPVGPLIRTEEADRAGLHRLSVTVHNPTDRLIGAADVTLGIVLPTGIEGWSGNIVLGDRRNLVNTDPVGVVYPQAYRTLDLLLNVKESEHLVGDTELKIFTPIGVRTINFSLNPFASKE